MRTPVPQIEPLENRIAPASVFTYTDVDGDQVKITSSKGSLQDHVTLSDLGVGKQLLQLDLRDSSFSDSNIKVTVKRVAGGDGFANIGFLNAAGNDLGKVKISGDLGKIVAGDADASTPAIKSLKVHSMGQFGLSTQGGEPPTGSAGLPPITSDLLQDLLGENGVTNGLLADIATAVSNLLRDGKTSSEGTLHRLLTNLDANLNALLQTTGIWYGLPDGARGLLGNIADVAGDLLGVNGDAEGLIGLELRNLLVEADQKLDTVLDSLLPNIEVRADVSNLLGLNLDALLGINLGGLNTAGGLIQTLGNSLDDLLGSGDANLLPSELRGLASRVLDLLDPILGGDAPLTPQVLSLISDLQGELVGLLSLSDSTPDLLPPSLESLLQSLLAPAGALLGGVGAGGAATDEVNLTSTLRGDVGKITVQTNIRDAFLYIQGDAKNIRINGSLLGDERDNGGQILVDGDLGNLTIKRGVIGGLGLNSGSLAVAGDVGRMNILGSVIGGVGTQSGHVSLNADAKALTIRGDLAGGAGAFSGSIESESGIVGKVDVRKSVIAGDGELAGSIRVTDGIKNTRIGGSLVGDETNPAVLSAAGRGTKDGESNLAFNRLFIRGSVNHADILAGYNTTLEAVNGDAQIGSIKVARDWIASNVSAGVESLAGTERFGDETDRVISTGNTSNIIASIALIQIKGSVTGTATSGDQYGFVAEEIGQMKVNKTKVPLSPGAGNDSVPLSNATGDVTVREVAVRPI